jgi:hypothetical protein
MYFKKCILITEMTALIPAEADISFVIHLTTHSITRLYRVKWMDTKKWLGKDMEISGNGLIYIPTFACDIHGNHKKPLSEQWCPGWDSN